jgi:hypothetical protein
MDGILKMHADRDVGGRAMQEHIAEEHIIRVSTSKGLSSGFMD